jgi:hypothetical protein
MAGNAVPRPMGAFAVGSATSFEEIDINISASQTFKSSGCLLDGTIYSVEHTANLTSASLSDLLDLGSSDSLSPQAAAGLLTRLIKSNRRIPVKLFDLLYELSKVRTSLRGTKIDSFRILHDELNAAEYRSSIQNRDL